MAAVSRSPRQTPAPASSMWTMGGLSLGALVQRTLAASWRDEVFGQGGRMAFYQFLAIFPSLFVCFALFNHTPGFASHLGPSLGQVSGQIFPTQLSQLFHAILIDFRAHPRFGLQLA